VQHSWWKQLLIGLVLFLAGYFMFGGGKIGQNEEAKPTSSISTPIVVS
jgi:hypothetical protein